MSTEPRRLLCIDLRLDADIDPRPDARCIAAAQGLLAVGRRRGWEIVHTRLRNAAGADARREHDELRPLMNERVLAHEHRLVGRSPALARLAEAWRGEDVHVVAFDPVALLSCLIETLETGPRFVLVDDVLPFRATTSDPGASDPGAGALHAAACRLSAGCTTLSAIQSRRAAEPIRLRSDRHHAPH